MQIISWLGTSRRGAEQNWKCRTGCEDIRMECSLDLVLYSILYSATQGIRRLIPNATVLHTALINHAETTVLPFVSIMVVQYTAMDELLSFTLYIYCSSIDFLRDGRCGVDETAGNHPDRHEDAGDDADERTQEHEEIVPTLRVMHRQWGEVVRQHQTR